MTMVLEARRHYPGDHPSTATAGVVMAVQEKGSGVAVDRQRRQSTPECHSLFSSDTSWRESEQAVILRLSGRAATIVRSSPRFCSRLTINGLQRTSSRWIGVRKPGVPTP